MERARQAEEGYDCCNLVQDKKCGDVRDWSGAEGRGVAAEEGGEARFQARDARLWRLG